MRTHNSSSYTQDRMDSAVVGAESGTSQPRLASAHLLSSSTSARQHKNIARSTRLPPTLLNEMAELTADIDGLPILVRILFKDLPAEMQSDLLSRGVDIHSLLSSMLEKIIDRMYGSSSRADAPAKKSLATVELISIGDPTVRLPALPNETVLRVGSLELDLLDRTAKRDDRQIDLRPREFRLLKHMMERSDKLLSRAALLKEVWRYRFVPETNLVDVHMGRLRRKVDGSNDTPMIRNVRGVGFVLSATPFSQNSPSKTAEQSRKRVIADKSPQSIERAVH